MSAGAQTRLGTGEPRIWGVRELVNYLSRQVRFDQRLQELGVRGEITDLSAPSGIGHLYFALKEPSGALIKCFVRAPLLASLPKLANGTEAIAFGALGVYEYRSQFQLFVTSVQLVGAGALAAVYERMKRKLEAEGLFEPARKRPIPRYPFSVALVSSPEAEGANDFRSILSRAPAVQVVTFPTPVQGPAAPGLMVRAVQDAARSGADVIVLARGGGSDEDRLPFNEEAVARAIAASRVPVITAIGHRGDHHIADDVADLETATPTAAAEMLVAGFRSFPADVRAMRERMHACLTQRIDERRARLRRLRQSPTLTRFDRVATVLVQRVDRLLEVVAARQSTVVRRKLDCLRTLEARLVPTDPRARLAERRARTAALTSALRIWVANRIVHKGRDVSAVRRRLGPALSAFWAKKSGRLEALGMGLNGKNPEAVLQRGYAIVRSAGRVVRSAADVRIGDPVEAQVFHGTFWARVEETHDDA